MKKTIVFLCVACFLCFCSVTAFAAPAETAPVVEILRQPQEGIFPEYSVAFYEVEAYSAAGNLSYQWNLIFEGETYDLSKPTGSQPWEAFAGEDYGGSPTGTSYHFGGILKGMDGAKIYCTVSDGVRSVDTEQIRVNVLGEGTAMPPTFKVPASLTVELGAVADLYCNATDPKGGTVSYEWSLCQKGDPYTREAIDHESAKTDTLHCDTAEAGTYYVVCKMTTAEGGTAFTHAIPVTVLAPEISEPDSDTSDVPVTDTDVKEEISSDPESNGTDLTDSAEAASSDVNPAPGATDSAEQTDLSTVSSDTQEKASFPILWVALPAAVVLIGGGSAGLIFLRKRK